jgi:hypothetical protein
VKLYAFDVDETLECSYQRGPISIQSVKDLRAEGNIIGLCGNFAQMTMNVSDWHTFISFIGSMMMPKAYFLSQVRQYCKADEYIMVGNRFGETPSGQCQDDIHAAAAGFRFISEKEFAAGAR